MRGTGIVQNDLKYFFIDIFLIQCNVVQNITSNNIVHKLTGNFGVHYTLNKGFHFYITYYLLINNNTIKYK